MVARQTIFATNNTDQNKGPTSEYWALELIRIITEIHLIEMSTNSVSLFCNKPTPHPSLGVIVYVLCPWVYCRINTVYLTIL